MTETERVPLETIQGKLLAALDDESKVGAILSKDHLDLIIFALEQIRPYVLEHWVGMAKVRVELHGGLCKLRKEAFGDKQETN